MEKPPYNPTALVEGIKNIEENIARFKEAIEKEEKKKAEFQYWLNQHELYEKEQAALKASEDAGVGPR